MARRFGDLADAIAARLPDREGLVFGASRYTFREVAARIDEAARRLIAAGVGHGEHVALWLNNCADWIFIAFAVQKIGAVLVPINTRFRSRDLAYVLAQSDSSFLITHDRSGPVDYAALVRERNRVLIGTSTAPIFWTAKAMKIQSSQLLSHRATCSPCPTPAAIRRRAASSIRAATSRKV